MEKIKKKKIEAKPKAFPKICGDAPEAKKTVKPKLKSSEELELEYIEKNNKFKARPFLKREPLQISSSN